MSCIEAGRWGYSRQEFAAGGRVLNAEIRESKAEAVTRSLKERRRRHSDQSAVWTSIDATLSALGTASATGALSDGFEKRADAIEDYLAAFKAEPGQVGLIYRIGGVLAGLDLFGLDRALARAYPKLVRGSALQALAGYENDGRPSFNERGFLTAALTASGDRFPAVGLGDELRIDTDTIGGAALHCSSAAASSICSHFSGGPGMLATRARRPGKDVIAHVHAAVAGASGGMPAR